MYKYIAILFIILVNSCITSISTGNVTDKDSIVLVLDSVTVNLFHKTKNMSLEQFKVYLGELDSVTLSKANINIVYQLNRLNYEFSSDSNAISIQ